MSKAPSQDTFASFARGVFVGAVVGGIAAWLLTPHKGTQNRQMIQQRMMGTVEQVQHKVQDQAQNARAVIGLAADAEADPAETL
ncbi:MAG: hypothetical protein HC837_06365 [Chloroflexaceae bacterium]|nr:hypothetical protein [Chloroflexaceae bacterium]